MCFEEIAKQMQINTFKEISYAGLFLIDKGYDIDFFNDATIGDILDEYDKLTKRQDNERT